jgi:glyoxylase-like metal-dependent hydrolase (beta-lactamase superfamily II)/rhodanese-related sulfurtransferase
MKIEQIYTKCLAQGSYYIENNGEAAVIDPLREVDQYIEMAAERGAKIKYIFETHFHADFVSGHVTLAEKSGAEIVYGPNAETNFKSTIVKDGQELKLGDYTIRVLHTPGHTMESTCYLLLDENGKENALFSGDTLFLGDVGRPDLAQKAVTMTQEELAGILFDSLRSKIMTLPDDVVVYPGHGAGSACGKNMSSETVGSIGHEKATNYALRSDMTKEEFVGEVTDGLAPPPAYFPLNVQMNKEGYSSIDDVIIKSSKTLTVVEFIAVKSKENCTILDVRHQADFSKSHIPGSIFIGLDGGFAPWVGAILKDTNRPLLLIVDESRVKEAIIRLSRVGFDNVHGYLKGGIEAWALAGKELDDLSSISAQDLETLMNKEEVKIFDVRKEGEFLSEHLTKAKFAPLDDLNKYFDEFPENGPFYVHCAGGYRSVIALSILKANGFHDGIDILGGYGALKETHMDKIANVCASTLR